jgi:hypothetical protein
MVVGDLQEPPRLCWPIRSRDVRTEQVVEVREEINRHRDVAAFSVALGFLMELAGDKATALVGLVPRPDLVIRGVNIDERLQLRLGADHIVGGRV